MLANVFNNLMVNCKFRAQTPSYKNPNNPEEGYDNTSVIDYNYYASGSQRSDIVFADASGVAYAWEGYNYAHKNYYEGVVDAHSVIATEQDGKDPLFENFSIHAVPLTSYSYDEAWDFHLKAGSPALTGQQRKRGFPEALFCRWPFSGRHHVFLTGCGGSLWCPGHKVGTL